MVFACLVLSCAASAGVFEKPRSDLSMLFEILYAVYDSDSGLIPDEPNEIMAMETSSDSRDQLVWQIFKLIRYELDPNSRPAVEETPITSDEALPALIAEVNGEVESTFFADMDDGFGMETMAAMESMIELPAVIDSEYILESGNVYHASQDIHVTSGGFLKHRAGAIVKWAQDAGLYVDPNGVYCARGKPEQWCSHLPDADSPTPGYWEGIKFVGGSSLTSLSELTYTYISYAAKAVVFSNVTLNKPCENNFFEFNLKGIVAYGPKQTRISNNVCYWNSVGIEAGPEDELGVTADPNHVIEIIGNTCHENIYGIVLYGTSYDLAVPTIMERNLSTASEVFNYALGSGNLGGYFIPYFDDNGRWLKYGGSQNTNYDTGSWESNPLEEFTDPFDVGTGYFDIVRLKPGSLFVNGSSSTLVWDTPYVGFTTSITDTPDKDYCDLGYHYAAWDYSNTGDPNLACDFDGDGFIGIGDLDLLSKGWLTPVTDPNTDPNLVALDVSEDGVINFYDFSQLAKEWSQTKGVEPEISAAFTDGEYGEKIVSLTDYDENTFRVFLFINGAFAKEIFLISDETPTRRIFIPWIEQGVHEAKIISCDLQGNVISGTPQDFSIDADISECMAPSLYKQGSPLQFSAKSPSDVRVSAWVNGGEIWSDDYSAGFVNSEVPAAVTDGNDIEYLTMALIEPPGGLVTLDSASGGIVVPTVSSDENFEGYTALMIRPDCETNFSSGLSDYVYDQLVSLGYKVKKLHYFNSTFKRIKKYVDNGQIKVLYFSGHGNYEYGGKKRSCNELDDCVIVSDKVSNYAPGQAPSWLEPLPPKIEASVKTWRELNFDDLKFAAFDSCYSMRLKINGQGKLEESTSQVYTYRGDLSMALLQRGEFVDQWIFGWADEFVSGFTSPWQGFSITLWEELGKKEDLADAVSEAYSEAPSVVRNAYRLQGHDDPFDFKL